ncbi:hypothetical protein [Piscinibacter terrae]|uniref:Lipoprotein n=1 Tax=Piscinibacter terrae TaxID=2496871 RepID=A0A3N7HI64_9BURK|nr:hypothetical protein [Albitalea terrae]RQP21734.1 hypothetical protein DZC73_25135 [Albitalea terrae]
MKLPALLLCLLTACAAPVLPAAWTRPGATDADLRATMSQCRAEASKQPLAPRPMPSAGTDPNSASVGNPAATAQDMQDYRYAVNECMTRAGWARK